jgi:Transglutaminase-like superfamily
MARLCWAQLVVRSVPFGRWQQRLGFAAKNSNRTECVDQAGRLAGDVEWAAKRLPFATKCLPRAMALSWMLRRKRIGHTVVIAVRPHHLRQAPDALHAWVEINGKRILGNLPGPWIETVRLAG